MAQQVLSGGRARFFIDGNPIAFASSVTISEEIVQEPVNVLDTLRPIEHVVTAYTVQMQCQIFKVPRRDLVDLGLWPEQGATPDEHKRILVDFPDMSAEIWDTQLDVPVAKVYGVKPRSRNITIQARGLIATQCTFVALYFADEGSANV
jgi:hypothetical protein